MMRRRAGVIPTRRPTGAPTRVVITGASSGIGAAAAAELRARGAEVVGIDLNPGDGVIRCDVRDQASVDAAMAEAVARLGGLDVLVNNAGIGIPQAAGSVPTRTPWRSSTSTSWGPGG